jgi:ribosomal protein S18 acetylase RimI-like enzyme
VRHLVTTSESLSISVATPSDLQAIEPAWWRLLNHQQGLDYRGSERELRTQINAERVRRFLDSRVRQGRLLIVRFDGELVGLCTFSPDGFILDAPTQVWEIADVWVEPHARRRGFATALVRECEQECRIRGADEVRLTVYALNDVALGLYQSLGYDVTSHTLSRNLDPSI